MGLWVGLSRKMVRFTSSKDDGVIIPGAGILTVPGIADFIVMPRSRRRYVFTLSVRPVNCVCSSVVRPVPASAVRVGDTCQHSRAEME